MLFSVEIRGVVECHHITVELAERRGAVLLLVVSGVVAEVGGFAHVEHDAYRRAFGFERGAPGAVGVIEVADARCCGLFGRCCFVEHEAVYLADVVFYGFAAFLMNGERLRRHLAAGKERGGGKN